MTAKLQVALDLIQGKRALQIAAEAVEGGADWIEAGTPLIKSEGMEIVRSLKKRCPGKTIVADLKTMDVGGLEAEMAAKSGADIVVIMGVSSDSTISEAVLAAARYDAVVMVDLMGVQDPIRRSKEVAALGATYVCVHLAVDDQMKGATAKSLASLIKKISIDVAVAGGITAESAATLAIAGADIIIVGAAITKSADVTKATRAIKKAISTKTATHSKDFKKHTKEELVEAFSKVSTPNICDAQHRQGHMKGIRRRNTKGARMVGKAVTVQTLNGDWAKPVEAIDFAKPGDVIIVDAGGGETAVWGELATCSAMGKGIMGVVVDGAVRDVDEIDAIGFPCFSRYVSSNAGEPKGYGGIGTPITCGGQKVRTGDWIIGDANGVVVVPAEKAVEVANRALDVLEMENRIREEIKRGSTLSKVLELKKWEKV
jgi:3-hexulose-6-phosphate synthase/6-phospho-3-hexuloisomerase